MPTRSPVPFKSENRLFRFMAIFRDALVPGKLKDFPLPAADSLIDKRIFFRPGGWIGKLPRLSEIESRSMESLISGVILIIDPNPINWTATQRLLDCQGYDVCRARDINSAIGLALRFKLGLIVCNDRVGDSPGPELVHRILQNHTNGRTAVMFTSKNQSAGVILRCHGFGPAMHLKQPVDPAVLLELVERMLGVPHNVPAPRSNRPVDMSRDCPLSSGFQPTMVPN